MRNRTWAVILLLLLVLGLVAGLLYWRRSSPLPTAGPGPTTPLPENGGVPAPEGWYAVMNVYLGGPDALPASAQRYELTLVKAALERDDNQTTIFEGARRLMLQTGVVEKILSEKVPQGRWEQLRLTFSPAAETVGADGKTRAGLVEAREVVIAMPIELHASRTTALFARLRAPLAAERDAAIAMSFALTPHASETYELGGIMLDTRSRGQIFELENASLVSVIKTDLGLDISPESALPGSEGFIPPAGHPSGAPTEGP